MDSRQRDATTTTRPPGWREITAGIVWASIGLCVFALWQLFAREFGGAVGTALHSPLSRESRVPAFWGFVVVAAVLLVCAVGALAARRWLALPIALLLAFGAVTIASGMYPQVAPFVFGREEGPDPRKDRGLSYAVPPEGFEPPTYGTGNRRSIP